MGSLDIESIRDNIWAEAGGWFRLPSFVIGMGRAIDLFGNLNAYRYAPSAEQADSDAIRRDFEAIGRDLRAAMSAK